MNICYELPKDISNLPFYERIKENVDRQYQNGLNTTIQTTVVPSKSARCIFVGKGISIYYDFRNNSISVCNMTPDSKYFNSPFNFS